MTAKISEVDELIIAVKAHKAVEAEKCPPECEDGTNSFSGPKGKRSAWFEGHWAREKATQADVDRRLGKILAERGVRIKTDGCGCCDSPALTVFLDEQFVCDAGNWYFDNLDGREVPK